MTREVRERDAAIEVAKAYAAEECVGELGEILDVTHEEPIWIVEFTTHTLTDEYEHRIRLNRVGNVFAHDRDSRLE